jgi:valyl-tRNA synthetase
MTVSREDAHVCEKCGSANITRDEDVLDTWFSSALWPFETLGWPDENAEDFKYFYPTDVLVTGYDIIFFWVARMIFSGCKQTGKTPFHTVLIHGLVRDDKGRKMSKSLGNGIDPLEMIDRFGSDALRMNMITANSPGNDMRFYVERCEAMRNFANKLWNASRYVLMNLSLEENELPALSELETADKWILSKLNTLVAEVTENLDKYELGIAVQKVYDFIWDSYCDWYIELTKSRLYSEDEASKLVAQKVLLYVLDQILRLMHPFMPFITEEIWQAIPHVGDALITAQWPKFREELCFKSEESAMESIMQAIRAVRNRRAEMNVPPSKKCSLYIVTAKPEIFETGVGFMTRLAYADEVFVLTSEPEGHETMASCVTHDAAVYMPMSQLVDVEKELARIAKEKEKAEKGLAGIQAKLGNPGFLAKAPEAVVAAEQAKAEKYAGLIKQLEESEARLKAL